MGAIHPFMVRGRKCMRYMFKLTLESYILSSENRIVYYIHLFAICNVLPSDISGTAKNSFYRDLVLYRLQRRFLLNKTNDIM